MELYQQIIQFETALKEKGQTVETFQMGLAIFSVYGSKGVLQTKLQKAAINPRVGHWQHLMYQLDKVKSRYPAPTLPPETKEEPTEAEVKVELDVDVELPAYVQNMTEDDLILNIRELAKERALLSNQLQEAGPDDTEAIDANKGILEKLAVITDEIERLEYAKQDRQAKAMMQEKLERVAIVRKDEQYTMGDLSKLELGELSALKKRVRDDWSKAKKRATALKTQKGRDNNAKLAVQKEMEIKLLEKVIAEKKING